jgi:hypothetical protein
VAVIIHQAICGEQNKAWDLLRTTFNDTAVAKKIAFKADLQDSPPIGIPWHSFIRGFSFNGYYLIIKTFPDTSPDVRNGRVFSHCLIIEKSDLLKIVDLSELFSIFDDEIDKTKSIEPLIIGSFSENQVKLPNPLQLRFNKVIQGFVTLENFNNTIIWVGQEQYEICVCKFWQLLTPTQKESFNFGINFNPSEIPQGKINFITILKNIVNKFENKGYCIVHNDDSVRLTDFSEQFLAGEANALKRLTAFTDAIDYKDFTSKEIPILAKGVTSFENLRTIKDLKLLITLSNIVAKFSPDKMKGASFKKRIIERICTIVETASENDLLLLKNFQIKSFEDSENDITSSTNKWIEKYLFSSKGATKNSSLIISQINNSDSINWWTNYFWNQIKNFLANINSKSVVIVWKWIKKDVNVLKAISAEIDSSRSAEDSFMETFPSSLSSLTLNEIKLFSISKNWYRLHAIIVKSEFDLKTALEAQLKVDIDINNFEGIELITKEVSPKEIINTAVSIGETRCLTISGKLCKNNPTLLSKIDIVNSNWQEILLTSINYGNKVGEGIKEPKKLFYEFLNLLVDGKYVNEDLLEKISRTDYANILDYPNRNIIWAKFPANLKSNFLEKTSSYLLEQLSKNSTYQVPSDKELSDFIISNGITTFLYYNRGNIKAVLPIFNTFIQLPEHILKDYIINYSGKLDVVDAAQLGTLVFNRNYSDVAYAIYNKTYHNREFKKALAQCYSLLDIITKGIALTFGAITKIEVSDDEWWDAFTELSYRLYNSGPTENKIWIQAGGKEYDLLTKGTGKEVWIAALQKLKKGGCTGLTVKKLLKAMVEEHSKNDELKTLKNLYSKL